MAPPLRQWLARPLQRKAVYGVSSALLGSTTLLSLASCSVHYARQHPTPAVTLCTC